jgi:ADP-heptose:LPS heptosyltransferase
VGSEPDILVIHPGGLGDVCLSESTFLSLNRHFGDSLTAVGAKRVLDQFKEYFIQVESIDGRAFAFLFSDTHGGRRWRAIVLIGKDRSASFRRRLGQLTDHLIFIDMYPDDERIEAEEFQLRQLPQWGIEPQNKEVPLKTGSRIILYPERPYQKEKWPVENFVAVREALTRAGLPVVLMGPHDSDIPGSDVASPEDLHDVAAFFAAGGFFFSNDSGMAHFAAHCGLRTLTLFHDTDPSVWRPKNGIVLTRGETSPTVQEVVEFIVSASRVP